MGRAFAYLIDRSMIDPDLFENQMSSLSQTTNDFITSDILSDDSLWGYEDELVLFHEVLIPPAYRRQGIGRELVRAILQKSLEEIGEPAIAAFLAPDSVDAEVARVVAARGGTGFEDLPEAEMIRIQLSKWMLQRRLVRLWSFGLLMAVPVGSFMSLSMGVRKGVTRKKRRKPSEMLFEKGCRKGFRPL
ncbi:hypothetical protein BDW02DRAFT_189319 [Decorospora gaudefroyi]|uniref:N-acetyltransferase domain-containing protein n=1 Tax=Decorospora gaudefroyi TaxID=184978 RepID=A0A6A5KMJ3_9PLEO|nr:hypothetical protein BDW02DRAFT_189319 [Decorospora gaudefroyi]